MHNLTYRLVGVFAGTNASENHQPIYISVCRKSWLPTKNNRYYVNKFEGN